LSTLKPLLQVNGVLRRRRETAAAMLAGLLVLLGIYSYFCIRLYSGYLLVHDDPANIGGTVEGGLRGWFTRGMAGYYHVYPEWPQPAFSNFYRPVWNLIIFVEQAVFAQHYWAWFLAFCAIQYGGTLLFLRVLRLLEVPARPALLFAILFLFSPAFVNFGFIYPGFEFDIFASLLLLAALHQLLKDRYGLALALIAVAVFTKETAVFAPVAAAVTVFILKRDVKWSVTMLTPLFAWAAARWLAFHAVMGGTFASPTNSRDLFINIAKGFIVWPSGAVPASFPLQLTGAYGLVTFAFLFMNAALWLILIHAGWQAARALHQAPQETESKLQAVLLTWLLGAMFFCMLSRPQIRFGASLYAFLLLFLARFLFVRARSKYLELLAVLILSFVMAIRAGNFLWHAVGDVSAERLGERALFAALQSLPQDGRTVFVVNAPVMLSAPRFLPHAWNLKLDITFINQFRGCLHADPADARYELSSQALSVEIPSCASYAFAGVPDDIQSKALIGGLFRRGIGTYQFPSNQAAIKRLASGDIDFGHTMRIRFTHAPATVLAYDWQERAYRTLGAKPR
jgi:hypothetical protein